MLSLKKSRFSSIICDDISGVTALDRKVLIGTAKNLKEVLVCGREWSFHGIVLDENVLTIFQLLRDLRIHRLLLWRCVHLSYHFVVELIGLYTPIIQFGRYATCPHNKEGGSTHIQSRETIGQENHVICVKLRPRKFRPAVFGAIS